MVRVGFCGVFSSPKQGCALDCSLHYCKTSQSAMGTEELQYGVRAEDFSNKAQLVTAIQKKGDAKHNQGLNNLHNLRRSLVLNPKARRFPLL